MTIFMKKCAIFQAKIDDKASTIKHKKYKDIIGFIIFLIIEIKPDIMFAILVASYFVKNSGHQYIKTIKTILQYFKRSKD